MTSRERLLAALEHREGDRIALDIGGTHVSTIHVGAYRSLCAYLGIEAEPIEFCDHIQQAVTPSREFLDRLEVDTRGLYPLTSHNEGFDSVTDAGDYYEHVDEWGFVQRMNKGDFWWSLVKSPVEGMTADAGALARYAWPVADDSRRLVGLREKALAYRHAGKAIVCKGLCAGLFEMGQRIRGMENFLCDMLADPKSAEAVLDKILELKKAFWAMTLDEIGDLIDVAAETDDYGTQESQLISYELYKKLISPRLAELIGFIRDRFAKVKGPGEKGYVFFHSCGNVRAFLPDFIDMGIDILNPVHTFAAGMSPVELKKDFGSDITFWGGGVETQNILPKGTPQQVRDDVKRNVEALAPGGGFVFATVHNIQAEVPPENVMAAIEALREFSY